jgi:Raf kinase inhibitor-like YbhB/YbcL family protein
MKLTSPDIVNGDPMPGHLAFCIPDPASHATFGGNRNPALAWDEVPEGTMSLALICVDPDAPSVGDDVNQEGREVPSDLPRADFYHWALIDLPADVRALGQGEFSDGVTPRGKDAAVGPRATRQGLNDYTGWFQADADMEGTYLGYDGPCPPWNDSIPHRYVFTLYALDQATCDVDGDFTGPEVLAAIKGHVLAQASLTGTYTLNPRLRAG